MLGQKEPLLAPWGVPQPALCWSGLLDSYFGGHVFLECREQSGPGGAADPVHFLGLSGAALPGRENVHTKWTLRARCRSRRRTWEEPRGDTKRCHCRSGEGAGRTVGSVTGEVASGDLGVDSTPC